MIINIVHDCIDPTRGGIESLAYYLLLELTQYYTVNGISVTIEDDSYKVDNIRYIDSELDYKVQRWKWLKNICANKREVINIAMTWQSAIPCFLCYVIYKAPFIVFAHGNEVYFNAHNKKLYTCIKKIGAKLILDKARYICCNSVFTKNLVSKISKNKNTLIIHPGIHFIENYTKTERNYSLLSLGRLVERKGVQFVVQAIPQLRKKYPGLKYFIAGDGKYRDSINRLIQANNLEDCVFLVGRVSEEEKARYFKQCDIFLMPSIDMPQQDSVEGFGMVYIEANMYGKYVVASNTGGISDAVIDGETGTLLNNVSVKEIERIVEDIYNRFDYIYSEKSIERRIRWAQKHSFKNIAMEHIKLLKSIDNF